MSRRTSNSRERSNRVSNRWTVEEDDLLLRSIRSRPQNLHRCFMLVAEQTGRTEGAVSNHWYTVTSKRPDAICFFTASPRHISKNRKNGMGVATNGNIWRRLMSVIRSIV